MELNEKETGVLKELEHLLNKHGLSAAASGIDEIVLNYVLGVLECLDCSVDEEEDVEPFAETMEAYLPGFSAIVIPEVGKWMLSTADRISHLQETDCSMRLGHSPPEQDSLQNGMVKTERSSSHDTSASLSPHPNPPPQHHHHRPRPSVSDDDEAGACGDTKVHLVVVEDADSDSVATLRELCPAAGTSELQHCLHMSGGNVTEAANLLLSRQEAGTVIPAKAASKSCRKGSKANKVLQNDESLKDSILAKYSFVDTSEDNIEHRPEVFKEEQKKMIRYRDSQVVSTKGERFSEIKKQESEEMKKTYVNIKPQRKFRFH